MGARKGNRISRRRQVGESQRNLVILNTGGDHKRVSGSGVMKFVIKGRGEIVWKNDIICDEIFCIYQKPSECVVRR